MASELRYRLGATNRFPRTGLVRFGLGGLLFVLYDLSQLDAFLFVSECRVLSHNFRADAILFFFLWFMMTCVPTFLKKKIWHANNRRTII